MLYYEWWWRRWSRWSQRYYPLNGEYDYDDQDEDGEDDSDDHDDDGEDEVYPF